LRALRRCREPLTAALAASIFHDNIQSIRELKNFLAAEKIEVRLSC